MINFHPLDKVFVCKEKALGGEISLQASGREEKNPLMKIMKGKVRTVRLIKRMMVAIMKVFRVLLVRPALQLR